MPWLMSRLVWQPRISTVVEIPRDVSVGVKVGLDGVSVDVGSTEAVGVLLDCIGGVEVFAGVKVIGGGRMMGVAV